MTGQDRAGRLTATSITIGTAKNQRTTCTTGTDRGEPTAPDTPRHRKRVCGRNRSAIASSNSCSPPLNMKMVSWVTAGIGRHDAKNRAHGGGGICVRARG